MYEEAVKMGKKKIQKLKECNGKPNPLFSFIFLHRRSTIIIIWRKRTQRKGMIEEKTRRE